MFLFTYFFYWFTLRVLIEKNRSQKELRLCLVDLQKGHDKVPREELWYCIRKSGVVEKYARMVENVYEDSETVVWCVVGVMGSKWRWNYIRDLLWAPEPQLMGNVRNEFNRELRLRDLETKFERKGWDGFGLCIGWIQIRQWRWQAGEKGGMKEGMQRVGVIEDGVRWR